MKITKAKGANESIEILKIENSFRFFVNIEHQQHFQTEECLLIIATFPSKIKDSKV